MIEITSPVKRFPGTVVLPDFLILPQSIAWETAKEKNDELRTPVLDDDGNPIKIPVLDKAGKPVMVNGEAATRVLTKLKPGVTDAHVLNVWIEAIKPIVSEWKLEGGFTADPFPFSPRNSINALVAWLITEISDRYYGADDQSPN